MWHVVLTWARRGQHMPVQGEETEGALLLQNENESGHADLVCSFDMLNRTGVHGEARGPQKRP